MIIRAENRVITWIWRNIIAIATTVTIVIWITRCDITWTHEKISIHRLIIHTQFQRCLTKLLLLILNLRKWCLSVGIGVTASIIMCWHVCKWNTFLFKISKTLSWNHTTTHIVWIIHDLIHFLLNELELIFYLVLLTMFTSII